MTEPTDKERVAGVAVVRAWTRAPALGFWGTAHDELAGLIAAKLAEHRAALTRPAGEGPDGVERREVRERTREELERALAAEVQSGHVAHGLLADICDAAFGDDERSATHGYQGTLERVRELAALARPEADVRAIALRAVVEIAEAAEGLPSDPELIRRSTAIVERAITAALRDAVPDAERAERERTASLGCPCCCEACQDATVKLVEQIAAALDAYAAEAVAEAERAEREQAAACPYASPEHCPACPKARRDIDAD